MDIQRPERKEFIKNLSKLIENSTARVDAFLQGLGWSKERILDERKVSIKALKFCHSSNQFGS